MGKIRLDVLLARKGCAATRSRAQEMIKAGAVKVNGEVVRKPGVKVDDSVTVSVLEDPLPYVSRGGLKLKKALEEFNVNMEGAVVIDIGASTGGFTDCSLKHGAARVYAVDVGSNQLAESLREDPRVKVFDQTNVRYMTPADLPEKADITTIDVSFISLTKIFLPVGDLLKDSGDVIALIKPQFEVGPGKVTRKGIVRDPEVHRQVLRNVLKRAQESGLYPCDLTFSPIKGASGNIEFLAHLKKQSTPHLSPDELESLIDKVVREAKELG